MVYSHDRTGLDCRAEGVAGGKKNLSALSFAGCAESEPEAACGMDKAAFLSSKTSRYLMNKSVCFVWNDVTVRGGVTTFLENAKVLLPKFGWQVQILCVTQPSAGSAAVKYRGILDCSLGISAKMGQ